MVQSDRVKPVNDDDEIELVVDMDDEGHGTQETKDISDTKTGSMDTNMVLSATIEPNMGKSMQPGFQLANYLWCPIAERGAG